MDNRDKDRILEWYEASGDEISIELVLTGSPQDEALKKFCDELVEAAPNVSVNIIDGDGLSGIRLWETLVYHAVPEGNELPPFLEALSMAAQTLRISFENMDLIEIPQKLRLYVSPGCPFCPAAIRKLIPLTASPHVTLQVIDGFLFSEEARKDNIVSAPTSVLDDQFRWTGVPDENEIVKIMISRDPSLLGSESLLEMISDGGASRVADMMIDQKKIFPAFVDLLSHEKWSVRLGAMVSMEEVFDRDGETGRKALPVLQERFTVSNDQIRGDLVYLLGVSGCPEAAGQLEEILLGDFTEEVKEAAREAMDTLQESGVIS